MNTKTQVTRANEHQDSSDASKTPRLKWRVQRNTKTHVTRAKEHQDACDACKRTHRLKWCVQKTERLKWLVQIITKLKSFTQERNATMLNVYGGKNVWFPQTTCYYVKITIACLFILRCGYLDGDVWTHCGTVCKTEPWETLWTVWLEYFSHAKNASVDMLLNRPVVC